MVVPLRKSHFLSAVLSVGGLSAALVLCFKIFLQSIRHELHLPFEVSLPWIDLPGLFVEFGILLDPLSILMGLVVTGVGLIIFIYSIGYMSDEPGLTRYFSTLSLFALSMMGTVLANNFITLFLFWELVGASSYLLIGYWYDRPQAAEAGKKAFLVNRIADFGFLLGILLLWGLSGEPRTLNFLELAKRLPDLMAKGVVTPEAIGIIALLIFCGVLGKSAQFPLHVWLPDAMEGPTPVSALIHAATMVAAGVYLLARTFFLFSAAPQVMGWVALVGGFTAFFAATLALVENDLKRILAYSTLSQLGYMVMALGLGGVVPGMYHLTTHAFFKALLFLGAGCVIHTLHTNNIWQMGGLVRSMPVTSITFFIAGMSLCGIFPLSGFFSKDEILALAFSEHRFLWGIGTLTAGMTAFYMGRAFCVAFLGSPRDHRLHAREARPIMTIPLLPLALLSVIGGFLKIPDFLHHGEAAHHGLHMTVAITSSGIALLGMILAYLIYAKNFRFPESARSLLDRASFVLKRKYFVDELYAWINQNIQQRIAILLSIFERVVIIGLWANGIARTTGFASGVLRLAQTGQVQLYALTIVLGASLLLFLVLR